MHDTTTVAQVLIIFGGSFIVGLLADLPGRHSPLPRVTLLLLAGFLIGPSVPDWLAVRSGQWYPVSTNVALAVTGPVATRWTLTRVGNIPCRARADRQVIRYTEKQACAPGAGQPRSIVR